MTNVYQLILILFHKAKDVGAARLSRQNFTFANLETCNSWIFYADVRTVTVDIVPPHKNKHYKFFQDDGYCQLPATVSRGTFFERLVNFQLFVS